MNRKLVLASNSPRRKELLKGLGYDFEVRIIDNIDESYPEGLPCRDIPCYIAEAKAEAYKPTLAEDELLITADTIVVLDGRVLGKPKDADDARRMLRALAGRTHQVITGVSLTAADRQRTFACVTDVEFAPLSDAEIDYYVERYKPLDKAGAYGIQEWIGFVAVRGINGSYFNVMGLPIQRLYTELRHFLEMPHKA